MRALVSALVVLALCGCQSKPAGNPDAGNTEPERLALLGQEGPLLLDSSPEECEAAFPQPADARKPASVEVRPGYPYAAWELPGKESFAAAFKQGGGTVKMVHRVRLENMKETEEAFKAYRTAYGQGVKRTGQGWTEVMYKKDGEKLILVAKSADGFVTFNESLERMSIEPEKDAKQ